MAKKGILRDFNNIEILPITRGELVLDSSGNPALHSNEFLATYSYPGLMSAEDKVKIDTITGTVSFTDTKVEQINTTTGGNYRLLFSGTADDEDRTEGARKAASLLFNPATGYLTAPTFVGDLAGNASSATKLATARTIWGQSFDGTGNITGSLQLNNDVAIYVKNTSGSFKDAFKMSSSDNFIIGYGVSEAGHSTYLEGNNVFLRYGQSHAKGFILNSSGNVTIGGSDLAGTNAKLYVDGRVYAKTAFLVDSDYGIWKGGQYTGALAVTDLVYNATKHAFVNGNVLIGTTNDNGAKLQVAGNVSATNFIGNLDGTYVNKLTGYTKATAISALIDTDTLNTALGKLEYKADVTYNLVKGAYDGDGTIENLAEILKVLEGISDTETIQAIVGKYLPLSGGTVTGMTTIQRNAAVPLYINSVGDIGQTLIRFRINGSNASSIGVIAGEDVLLRYNSDLTTCYKILDTGNTGINNGTITINGVSIIPLTQHQSLANYLPLSGGTMNGPINYSTSSGNNKTSNYISAGGGFGSGSGRLGLKLVAIDQSDIQAGIGVDLTGFTYETTISTGRKDNSTASYITFATHNVDTSNYIQLGYFKASGNTNPTVTFNVSGTIQGSGFVKTSSSDSYVLLGGGGHKAVSDFLLKTEFDSKELASNLTTITKTLTVTKDWMDTGISGSNLSTGTYIVQLSGGNTGDGLYYCVWSGVMSWYSDNTNDDEHDEIILHRAGHAYSKTIYLRTIHTASGSGGMKLQIAASNTLSSASYTFKFKRVI